MQRIVLLSLSFFFFTLFSSNAQTVIEDFEDGNNENILHGYWYDFNDNGDGGKSRVAQGNWKKGIVSNGGYESSAMLSLDVTLEKGDYKWKPYYAVATQVKKSSSVNPKNFDGISYWHKGVAHTFRVSIPEVKDYDFHKVRVPASEEWTKVVIDFTMLRQEGWGNFVELNVDNSFDIVWNLEVESGHFQIDDVQFENKIEKISSSQIKIEDFEDGNSENLMRGYWYEFNDNGDGGKSELTQGSVQNGFVTTNGHESSGMLSLDVVLEKADYKWSPYYGLATQVNKTGSMNPKNFDGISYWHKGVGHDFRVDIPEVKDYDNHKITIPASDEWTKVVIDFSMLQQEGWGKRVKLNLDNSVNIVWNLNVASGKFQIDDVQFEKEIVYQMQNNMEILPAEIPAPLPQMGNVKTRLNKLSQKYLTKGMNFTNWGESGKITSPDPSTWKYNEASIKKQADQGLLGIRLPIDFDLYIVDRKDVLNGTKKNIEIEPILYTVLDSMNVWTKRHNVSLTIDYHAYDATYDRAASKNEQFKGTMASLWRVIAQHFVKEKREDLFFELTNEPCLSLPTGEFIDQADWTSLAQMMIDSIRTVDKKRPLIFGDTKWYSLDELIKNKPFEDTYIIYCFHMYDPFIFSHQGATWSNMGSMKHIPFPYSPEKWSTEYRDFGITDATPDWVKEQVHRYYKEGNKQHIKNRLTKVKNWAYEHNVPLICNEWGAYPRSAKLEDLNAYFKTMGEIFQEMDISWQVWFGVMDNDGNLLPGMADALGLEAKK